MYSAHLQDMYNFDPAAVDQFLKEMRLLSAHGQTSAQAMKTKMIPLPGIVATNARASGHDDDNEGGGEAENAGLPREGGAGAKANSEAAGKRDGGAGIPAGGGGVDQPRGSQRYLLQIWSFGPTHCLLYHFGWVQYLHPTRASGTTAVAAFPESRDITAREPLTLACTRSID